MWYAIVANDNGNQDTVYEFSRRDLRDAWVRAGAPSGPGERRALTAREVRKTPKWMIHDGDAEAWRVIATQRVESDPAIARYASVCLLYDWGEPAHWRWLATARSGEIAAWAAAIEKEASVE